MKLHAYLASFIVILFSFIFVAHSVNAYYPNCGDNPCRPGYDCDSPWTCDPGGSQRCGASVAACNGATCQANFGGFRTSGGCGDYCTGVGTTNTSSFGACSTSATCGNGTKLCGCVRPNSCPIDCSGTACNATAFCCTDQSPVAPSGVTAVQVNDAGGVKIRKAKIDWVFNETGSGCGLSWGLRCPEVSNTNSFLLKFNNGKTNETVVSTSRTLDPTGLFPDWGSYTVQVCAENGARETCAAAVPFTLTPPPCETSGEDVANATPDDTCIGVNPNLSASWTNNANQIQFLVHDNSSRTLSPAGPYNNPPYPATSSWLAASPASYVPTLGTGRYYWNVHSQSVPPPATPIACTTPAAMPTGMEINIDKTAPAVPVFDPPTIAIDPACLTHYFVSFPWNTTSDVGCAGLPANPYQGQISETAYSSPTIVKDTGWTAALTMTTNASYAGGTHLFSRVRAQDAIPMPNTNISAYTNADAGDEFVVPLPTPYPTIYLKGEYEEDLGFNSNDCVGGMTIDPTRLNVGLNFSGAGASYTCNKYPTYFECFITINNVSVACIVPTMNVTLNNATYDGYVVEWRQDNVCTNPAVNTIPIDASIDHGAVVPTPIKTYFKYGQQTWFKTSGVSFNNRVARTNTIPNNTAVYDATTDDSIVPPDNKLMIIKNGGLVTQNTTNIINVGANATEGYSENKWHMDTYNPATSFTPAKFTDYMKSRKAYKTITAIGDITADGIYYVNGNLTIASTASLANRKVLIVSDQGTVNITTDITPAGSSLAIIANAITIDKSVNTINAILIGNTVAVGDSRPPSAPSSLKVVGNLISLANALPDFNTRVASDRKRPSLFIKLDSTAYINLLQYLSVSVYDWKQVQ